MVEVLTRSLGAVQTADIRLLEALAWDTGLGTNVRLWLGRGAERAMTSLQPDALRITSAVRAGGNLVLSGMAEDPPVFDMSFAAGTVTVSPVAPETGLLAGCHVLLGQYYDEPPEVVAGWLSWHATHHGTNAAILLDRRDPNAPCLAATLADALDDCAGIDRVIVVTCPLPLGHPGSPALGHPATAPRVRGRGVPPNPWLAPLAEPAVFDALKWRFLARATSVALVDICDLIQPDADAPPVIERVLRSHTGLMPIGGAAVYPWRIRKGRAPGFGDHICRPDPPIPQPQSWAATPARLSPEAIWLPQGPAGQVWSDDESATYDRHMALRFAGSPVQDLVNKDALFEDPALAERAERVWSAKPVRAPERAAQVAPAVQPPPTGRTVIVTCMKNEGPFILEWVAYHRMIGVDDILVYTNDCTDGTDTLLDRLAERGLVQRRDNPFRAMDMRPQHAALALAPDEPVVQSAGWILPIDVDEFVNIHVGDGALSDLYGAVPDAQAISLTWRLFGNADLDSYADRPVIEHHTRCAPQVIRRPHQAWGFKTLYRNDGLFAEMGVHRPKGLLPGARPNWVNGSGAAMPLRYLRTGWRSGLDSYGYDLVTLNHYAVRNCESFLVKRDRGRVNHVTRDQGEAYWFRMNNNAEEDRSIQRHLGPLADAMRALMADPAIAAAHQACVAAHRLKIDALLRDPGQRAFFDQLTSPRMARLSRMHRHFGMNVFLNGPSVIPDTAVNEPVAPDYFFNTGPPDGRAAD